MSLIGLCLSPKVKLWPNLPLIFPPINKSFSIVTLLLKINSGVLITLSPEDNALIVPILILLKVSVSPELSPPQLDV